jgi:hypothetical protein
MEMRDGQIERFGAPPEDKSIAPDLPPDLSSALAFPEHKSTLMPADRQTAMQLAKAMS